MLMSECFIDMSERLVVSCLARKINSIFGLPLCDSKKGVYGDVQRVKILYNKKDSALIQMADGNQSQLGKIKLHVICMFSIQNKCLYISKESFVF